MKGRQLLTLAVLCGLPYAPIAKADDINQAAADLCKCFGDSDTFSAELLAAMETAKSSGDFTVLMPFQQEMMTVMDSFEQCFSALPAKYPEINSSQELQQQVMAKAEESCSHPATFLMNQ